GAALLTGFRLLRSRALGLPSRTGAAMRQMLLLKKRCVYTRRFPWREIVGWMTFSPRETSRCGLMAFPVHPGAAILHRPPGAEKTISCPSAAQAGLVAPRFSKVIRFAAPMGLIPSENANR